MLAFTWLPSWDEEATETLVRFDLDERDGVTRVRLTHSGFATEGRARAIKAGRRSWAGLSPMPKVDPESHERARRKFKKSSKTEICNDLPHHDLGGRRMDRSLADTVPVRRERSDHVAIA